ncbi:nickel pincer cofactor biosynthesis protein LarC [Dactylococcopsis salina]|uniref:Putative nickel insertion protein n=1 Tax=Dactylococcopsis salina (strain PCC 8305) TaxID=13035 RepID=K9YR13_DACS8|nr:nickel pincer cofactor biosynthesis protein LarC [Dactylococcopsis salina]AFZ48912.1 TIGR00299 family protein [Dactylococcopsis salina PCC 8305]
MTKVVYFDCPTGIAGDMCLGALVDAGFPMDYLTSELKRLGLSSEYQLSADSVSHNGQVATKVEVTVSSTHPPHRHLPDIEALIKNANLPNQVERWSIAVFKQLAIAEGKVHGVSPDQVHFHEVGATDAIVDIVGTCLGLHWLGIETIYCSAFPTGGGTVKASHGELPVPVPAVIKLWESRNVPIYSNGINKELVTPTGAALMVTLATRFGRFPEMTVEKVGLGGGNRRLSLPNILRLWVGESIEQESLETVAVLETQIDDVSPQVLAYCCDLLFNVGALDVFTQGVTMKKSRLGTLVTVICPVAKVPDCEEILFRETSTIGIRRQFQQRNALKREIQEVETGFGKVRVKVAFFRDKVINRQPEYEDCLKLAQKHKIPLLEVQKAVLNQ